MRTFVQKSKTTQQAKIAKPAKPVRTLSGQSSDVNSILHLQRTIGNQAVQQLLQANTKNPEASSASYTSTGFAHNFSRIPVYASGHSNIQPKLKVNAPGNKYEQEADRVAGQALCSPGQPLDPAAPLFMKPRFGYDFSQVPMRLQRRESSYPAASVADNLNLPFSGEQPLSPALRSYFEPRFGVDFSQVQIHRDRAASKSAENLQADAFTLGRHVFFRKNKFAPHTTEGKKLLAHELTHVVQQQGQPAASRSFPGISAAGSEMIQRQLAPFEEEEIAWERANPVGQAIVDPQIGRQTFRIHGTSPSRLILWNFAVGGTKMKPEHEAWLIAFFVATQDPTQLSRDRVIVEGHTSDSGQLESTNKRIALARAKNVRDFLIKLGLLRSNQILFIGWGSRNPYVPNDTPENMAINRMVEINIEGGGLI